MEEFSDGDHDHIEATPARVRRAYAEAAVRARDEFKDQAALVAHQAGLKRRHLPVRDFVRNAADVLLALKPCWAMSPLVVSQLLPPRPYFDVVVFDEASQITPADAVTSILRGKQLVVAGDDKQLPPTAFFVSDTSDDDPASQKRKHLPPCWRAPGALSRSWTHWAPCSGSACCRGTTEAATNGSSPSPTHISTTGR